MYSRRNFKNSEKLDTIALYTMLAFMLTVVVFVIYAHLKKHLRKNRSRATRIPSYSSVKIASEKQPQSTQSANSFKQTASSGSVNLRMETPLSPSFAIDMLTEHGRSKKTKIRRSDSNKKSTAYVQDLIRMRTSYKTSREKEIDKETKKEEEKKLQHKLEWQAELQKRKLQLSLVLRSSEFQQEPKDEKLETEATPSSSESAMIPARSVVREAKLKLHENAKYLLDFSYLQHVNSQDKMTSDFIMTLAFVYRYHLYNLARRILYDANDNNSNKAVKLRTLIVHATNKINISSSVILETQKRLRDFVSAEVAHLTQRFSYIWQGSDRTIQELVKLSGNPISHFTFETMDTLPLSRMFYQSEKTFSDSSDSPTNISIINLYAWMKQKVIPFINFLNEMSTAWDRDNPSSSNSENRYHDAIKFMIIILGNYCTRYNRTRVSHAYSMLEPKKDIAIAKITEFMSLCRKARNSLAHDIFQLGASDLSNLLLLASEIASAAAVPEIDNLDTLLSPGSGLASEALPRLSTVSELFGTSSNMQTPSPDAKAESSPALLKKNS
jgi:hypothetical protein